MSNTSTFLNVKEAVHEADLNQAIGAAVNSPKSFRELNEAKGDSFVQTKPHTFSAAVAIKRLTINKRVVAEWKRLINMLDEREMPAEIREKYECIYSQINELNDLETLAARKGE